MIYNISFDICAAVITLVALNAMIYGRDLGRLSNRILLSVIVMHLISCVFDIWSSVANSYIDQYGILVRDFTNYVFLGVHTSEAFVFLCFLLVQLDVWGGLSRGHRIAIALPEILMVLLPLALNPVLRGVFTYDRSGFYIHGGAMPLLYVGADLYMAACILVVIRNRSSLTPKQRNAAVALLLLSIVPMLVQSILMPRQLIEMFFQALGFYGYMQSVENPDEFRHPVTRARNRHALLRDMNQGVLKGLPMTAVIVKLSQVDSIRVAEEGSLIYHGIRLHIAEWFQTMTRGSGMRFYDCERGIYVILRTELPGAPADRPEAILRQLEDRFGKPWQYRGFEVMLTAQTAFFRLPESGITIETFLQMISLAFLPAEGEGAGAGGVIHAEPEDMLLSSGQREDRQALPEDLQRMLDQFAAGIQDLTPAERNILHLYMEGYEISEIPEKAFISMNTVKKHNKNIYRKLAVGSREELMLYVDLFRQCGRIEDLYETDAPGKGGA